MKKVLVTGGAGFIGSHLVDRLLCEEWQVTVVDNFDPFYDVRRKEANIAGHLENPCYCLIREDIRNLAALQTKLSGQFDVIVHLAAKAGVRPSIQNPSEYQAVNVLGTQNLLELARQWGVKQFVFASSSSVYGINPNVPWRETDQVLLPISSYAATKVAGELLGHVYSHLYGIRFIGLRFFTVYGPRQRPDLAIHKFARLIQQERAIPVYGDGSTKRDYTFIDDIITGITAAMQYRKTDYEIINLGNNQPVKLLQLIRTLEDTLQKKAQIQWLPQQPGDVPQTCACVEKADRLLGYCPATELAAGMGKFIRWVESSPFE